MFRSPIRSIVAAVAPASLALAVLLAGGTADAAAPPTTNAARGDVIVVRPGASIQAAIDHAPARATIRISPGTYAENVLIIKPITLIDEGATLTPPSSPRQNACSSSSPDDRLPGICVLGDITVLGPNTTPVINGYVDDVHVSGLRITGFPGSGVFGYATNRLQLAANELDHNGLDGAISLAGHHTVFAGNDVHDNGVFGLTIEDSPDARATITSNKVYANLGTGVLVRDGDHTVLIANDLTANCAGVLAVATSADSPTSEVHISAIRVTANNRFCEANADGYPAFSGIGVALLGATNSTVQFNVIIGHRADDRDELPSGGIILLDTTAIGGSVPQHNVLSQNVVLDNQDADVLTDESGINSVTDNACGTSIPTGLC